MVCITPPALTEEQLLALSDGLATTEVVAHVQQCNYCRRRAQQLAQQQNQLAMHLYRAECPSSLELGEYHLALLSAERVATIEQHLRTCLHCVREIQTLQTFLAEPALAPTPISTPTVAKTSLGSQVKRLIAKLLSTSSNGGLTPALAGLRGDQAEQHVYEANGVQIVIEVQAEAEPPGYKMLLGLVLGLDITQTFEAHLQQTSQTPLTTPIDEFGNFVFEHLWPGSYTLLLRSLETEIQIEALKL